MILIHRDGPILRVELARPEKKNAITRSMYQALSDALVQADEDRGVRVVVLHGAPGVFTAGNDLGDFLENPPRDPTSPVFRFLQAIAHFGKPLVAAVSGPAVGIGTTMLLHCDFVFAADDAKFSLPFVMLALCPEAASSYLLPRVAGYQRAAELLMLGEPFPATRAKECGIVTEVVPAASLLEKALATARKLAERPPASLRITKALMRRALLAGIEQALASEQVEFGARLNSPEAREAFAAFFERRPADFSKFD